MSNYRIRKHYWVIHLKNCLILFSTFKNKYVKSSCSRKGDNDNQKSQKCWSKRYYGGRNQGLEHLSIALEDSQWRLGQEKSKFRQFSDSPWAFPSMQKLFKSNAMLNTFGAPSGKIHHESVVPHIRKEKGGMM